MPFHTALTAMPSCYLTSDWYLQNFSAGIVQKPIAPPFLSPSFQQWFSAAVVVESTHAKVEGARDKQGLRQQIML